MGLFSWLFGSSNSNGLTRAERKIISTGARTIAAHVQELIKLGDAERARQLLREGLARYPGDDTLSQFMESVDKTITWTSIETALTEIDGSTCPELRARLAEMYWRVGDKDTALSYGREAINLDPDHICGYRVLGRVHLEQFRATGGSIEGMNALRCLFKAHQLAPTDSNTLLRLAELFIILKAPVAASKFLLPVKRAFENDAQVVHLASKIEELPPESTSQIQDLFLKLERRELGETGTAANSSVSAETRDRLIEIASTADVQHQTFILDAGRELIWSSLNDTSSVAEISDSLGILCDTARKMSVRMGIGEFEQLFVETPEANAFVGGLSGDMGLLQVGPKLKRSAADKLHEKIDKLLSKELAGAQR